MQLCGVIALSNDVPKDRLYSWFVESLLIVDTPNYVGNRIIFCSPHFEKVDNAIVASRYSPVSWSQEFGYNEKLSSESLRADDDCSIIITSQLITLRSTNSGSSTFFVHRTHSYIVFSTAMGQIATARTASLDKLGIGEVLRFGAGYSRRTILKGIERVPFAHQLCVNNSNKISIQPFKFFNRTPDDSIDKDIVRNQIRETLINSLGNITEKPLLLFSGGVDSSLIAQILTKLGVNFQACMLSFGKNDCEKENADNIAHILKMEIEHRTLSLDFSDVINIISSYVTPTLDFSILPTHALGQAAIKKINSIDTRIIDGTGGDAWFGFRSLQNTLVWRNLGYLSFLRKSSQYIYSRFMGHSSERLLFPFKVMGRLSALGAPGLSHMCATPLYSEIIKLSSKEWLEIEESIYGLWKDLVDHQQQDDISQVLVMDATFIATSQFAAKTSQWDISSQYGTFYPFLTPQMVDIARKIPFDLLIDQGHEKPLLKELMVELGLPNKYAVRQKSGFQPPLQSILSSHDIILPLLDLLKSDIELVDIFGKQTKDWVIKYISSSNKLSIQMLYPIWGFIVITIWVKALRSESLKY